jgi:ubiquinone/menaquinone biosynthesis C-methylase UbiE
MPAAMGRPELGMDYDKSDIATIYDEARALTPDRVKQWEGVLSAHIDRRAISTVVDLGCGTGRFTGLLAAHFGAEVIGIDPSQRMLDQARGKLIAGNVEFRQASAEALPLSDRSVDLLFMSQVYHHLADPAAVARECCRVLRRDGHACLRNTTRDCDFVYRHFFPLQSLIEADLPSRDDVESTFVAAGFAATAHQVVRQLVAADWPSFIGNSALRGDSFLARLPNADFTRGMAALRAYGTEPGREADVTEEIDWFVFTKPA